MEAIEIEKIRGILADYGRFEEGSSWSDRLEFMDSAMRELEGLLEGAQPGRGCGEGRLMVEVELVMRALASVEAEDELSAEESVRLAWEGDDGFVRDVLEKAVVADFIICPVWGGAEPSLPVVELGGGGDPARP